MKRSLIIISFFLFILMSVIMLASCSRMAMHNCFDNKTRGCVSCGLECSGMYIDCTDFCIAMFCGEEITDMFCVDPCYTCASCVRQDENCSLYKNKLEDLEAVDNYNYTTEYDVHVSKIDHLTEFYKVKVNISVMSVIDIKDAVVRFDISDSNGNKINNYSLYIAEKIKGDSRYVSAEYEFIFRYPTDGKEDVNIFSEDYEIVVSIDGLFGKI